MANGFRIISIHLDKNEDVSGAQAFVDEASLDYINRTIGDVRVQIRKLNDPPVAHLSIEQVRALREACGKVQGTDPGHVVTDDIRNSLSIVMNMLDEAES